MGDSKYLTKEFNGEFLGKYREFPCLWKMNKKDYTNQNLKIERTTNYLHCVRQFIQMPYRDFVIKKIESFRKELKKVEDSKRSGRSADDIRTPTLWYYHLPGFTVDQNLPTESVGNFNNIKGERI